MPLIIDDSFARAVDIVLRHEGGISNDPNDPGGMTKYGISLRFLELMPDGDITGDGKIDELDIAQLTRDQAIDLYWRKFWNLYHYNKFHDWKLAAKLFDLAVNMGPMQSHKLLQQALHSVGMKIKIDGKLGAVSFKSANAANRDALLAALRSEAAGFYRTLCAKNKNYDKFLAGWLNRAYA
jgi:lysozyme family protein